MMMKMMAQEVYVMVSEILDQPGIQLVDGGESDDELMLLLLPLLFELRWPNFCGLNMVDGDDYDLT